MGPYNVGILPQHYTASQPMRPQLEARVLQPTKHISTVSAAGMQTARAGRNV